MARLLVLFDLFKFINKQTEDEQVFQLFSLAPVKNELHPFC
jgi:hypothetical protein